MRAPGGRRTADATLSRRATDPYPDADPSWRTAFRLCHPSHVSVLLLPTGSLDPDHTASSTTIAAYKCKYDYFSFYKELCHPKDRRGITDQLRILAIRTLLTENVVTSGGWCNTRIRVRDEPGPSTTRYPERQGGGTTWPDHHPVSRVENQQNGIQSAFGQGAFRRHRPGRGEGRGLLLRSALRR